MIAGIDNPASNRAAAGMLAIVLLLLGIQVAVLGGRWLAGGDGPLTAYRGTGLGATVALAGQVGTDSLRPMLAAYDRDAGAGQKLYTLQQTGAVKFQYPPTALLPFDLVPRELMRASPPEREGRLRTLLTVLSWLSLVATAGAAVAIILAVLPADGLHSFGGRALLAGLVGAAAVLYYPLVRAYELGQVQLLIDALSALALLAMVRGRSALAGVLVALATAIKPQLGLLLLWALLRRDWVFCRYFCIAGGALLAWSLVRFGWLAHVDYLQGLSFLSRHGEAYWTNQSVNGVLNRLYETAPAAHFQHDAFPVYHRAVHLGTLLSSAVLLAWALVRRPATDSRGRALDFGLMLAVATIASPIAWDHHYGVLFAVHALALALMLGAARVSGTLVALLVLSWLLCALSFRDSAALISSGAGELLRSHLLVGGLLLAGLVRHFLPPIPHASGH